MLRPRILVTVARMVASAYCRHDHCPAVVHDPDPAKILANLRQAEADLEAERRDKSPAYKPSRHVRFLGALIAEAERGHQMGGPRTVKSYVSKRPLASFDQFSRTPTDAEELSALGLSVPDLPIRKRNRRF